MSETQKQKKSILLTGSTGNFGKFLALDLLKDPSVNLDLLVRASPTQDINERVSEIINYSRERVAVHNSDLSKENLGLSPQIYNELSEKTTHVLHSAASTRFNLPLEEARLHNVIATRDMLEFAKKCSHLVRFGFLSTVTVAGRRTGLIKEDEFEHNEGFSNTYQQSKYEAEALVRAEKSKLPIVIFRPPFIISPDISKNEKAKKNFLSILISLIAKEYLPIVPGTGESTMDIVSSHDAARVVASIFLKDDLSYMTYNISNGSDALTIDTLHKMVEEKIGHRIPVEYCGDLNSFSKRLDEISNQNPAIKEIYKKAESFVLEPAFPKIFDNQHTLSEMGTKHLGEDPLTTLKQMFKSESWNL